MTAAAFAELLQARPTGPDTWQARCPAHDDRSPSLSLREGQDGRVLIHCFAGCTHTAILAKLRLAQSDLFAGPPPSPAQLALLQAEREARENTTRTQKRELREAWDRVRKWQAVVDRLGAKLAQTPDTEARELARLFAEACNQLHQAETEAERREAYADGKR